MKLGIRTFIAASSSFALLMAFFYEYYLGYMPCDLCIYQRIPYFLLIVISLIRNKKIFKYLSIIILLCSVSLSVYHTQVESGALPDTCAKKITHSLSSAEILRQINSVERPSCGVVSAKIIGVSMSVWNALFSIFLIFVILIHSNFVHKKQIQSEGK